MDTFTNMKGKILHVLAALMVLLGSCNSGARQEQSVSSAKVASPPDSLSASKVFTQNCIGVVYLDTMNAASYSLVIRFPYANLPERVLASDTSDYTNDIPLNLPPQTIILFDEAGRLATLEGVAHCVSRFWCENDGGIKYEPTYVLTVPKEKLRRPFNTQQRKRLGGITAFAVIHYNASHFGSFYPVGEEEDENIAMRGRLSSDYSGYADKAPAIYKYYDRNVQIVCSAKEVEEFDDCIFLEVFNHREPYELGCCGP